MNRLALIAVIVFVSLAVGGLVAYTTYSIDRDREELIDRFAEGHKERLEAAISSIESSLDDVADDITLASRLVGASDSVPERRQLLTALIGAEAAYLAGSVLQAGGAPHLVTAPRLKDKEVPPAIVAAMRETARRAVELDEGGIEVSTPVTGEEASWFRVFATPLPKEEGREPGALALLVNTRPFFEKLRVVAAGPSSELLLLGAQGRPAPISSERLISAVGIKDPKNLPGVTDLVTAMRAGNDGTAVIGLAEASRLGFEPGEVTVAYAPIRLHGAAHWSAAVLTSLSSLRTHEEALIRRIISGSFAIALALLGFAAYVVITSRRSAVLRERLRHADELAHLREKAEKVLENIPSAVMVLSDSGRITSLNQALRAKLPEPALGATVADAFPKAERAAVDRLVELLARALAERRTASEFGERLLLFGEEGQYNLHAVPLEPHSPEARTLLVIEDFTEVSALQSQLLRAEKLATVGILAAGIAHEIGTPLGVIRGRAEYTLRKLGDDHLQAAGLKVIVEQIDRVSRTIRELLDFSRVKVGAVSRVEVGPLVNKVQELLKYEAQKRRIKVDLQIANGLPPLAADPDQLQQVLVNLLMNAFDASSDGETVRVIAQPEGTAIRLEIVDDGCGIPPENVHRVFDPFFTTKKRGQGTGLGLTIVSQIVRGHGAEIEIESKAGRGTRVVLTWPSAPKAEERARAV
jgi:two-component system, NtrC family, sensor histidine kinase HydH